MSIPLEKSSHYFNDISLLDLRGREVHRGLALLLQRPRLHDDSALRRLEGPHAGSRAARGAPVQGVPHDLAEVSGHALEFGAPDAGRQPQVGDEVVGLGKPTN